MSSTAPLNLDSLRAQIQSFRSNSNISEAQTKEWLIRPFFEALGWRFSNPLEVVPEDGDEAGQRVDYCLYSDGVPKVLIEAKSLKNSLNDQQMVISKLNYCSNRNIPLLILTNGDSYKIFFNEIPGIGLQKLLFEFNISGNPRNDLLNKLSKLYIQSDNLLHFARRETVFKNVHAALEELLQKSDPEMLELINRNLQRSVGHKFHVDEIMSALKHIDIHLDSEVENEFMMMPEPSIIVPYQPILPQQNYSVEAIFKNGARQESFQKYTRLIKLLNNWELQFELIPKKLYISLVKDKYIFCQISALKMGLQIYIKLEYKDLTPEEQQISRDVKNIGHLGGGNLEVLVKTDEDLVTAANLIKRSYEYKK